ncbi:sensor histidine kinase [Rossellomorea vietnamensis]|uniref:Sensor histidine kinase n=1 Tax=Rossellomorea aquimaris TaxID=189382 RepID=A0A5D4U7J9_9BACI|nr:sensor histidine kinase [Rossellomorea aquimaris]TYS83287.1 sensor histidine kinase [Rossellomorea aquimaris]
MMALMGTLIFFLIIQFYLLITETPSITLAGSLYLTLLIFLIFSSLSIYFGIRTGSLFKGRLDDISTFVSVLRSGRFSARVDDSKQDEIGIITDELNQLAVYIQEQVKILQRLADEKSELADQAHQAAVMEERHRLARDLHDSVSQQLFALNMLSSAAVRTVRNKPKEAEPILQQVAEIAAKAQGEMRALLLHLRPIDLKGENLAEGLKKLIRELIEKTPIEITPELDHLEGLTKGTEAHLFRIVQEGISNILRHAEATHIKISTKRIDSTLNLYISDNGKGFSVNQQKMTSYGLQTMRERCEEIGGVFQIRSKENEGTYINIRIPLKEEGESGNG